MKLMFFFFKKNREGCGAGVGVALKGCSNGLFYPN
jgi:hypothetical protein